MNLPGIWHSFEEDHLVQRLLFLAKMVERVSSRKLQAEFGISVAQWRVLAFVCIQGPATGSMIGESAEIDPAEISRAVKTLIADGLVTRDFAQRSRKAKLVSPTEKGHALFLQIRDQRREYFGAITGFLGPEKRADINRSLESIAEAVVAERDLKPDGPAVSSHANTAVLE
ncbi:MarR family winged helix-turn-helix transcriptional regulator [Altericroceibacterium xinjiangense]|uniref:MarR family winged helix-turn-helix transcriptional regulator n=1 Tax=Altericroceibacterium xinjiangense TaxID=762261 RepID=UPI000F7FA805|nr:MarR family winged helix-turn-helix transcriptional regulator [Altericroceibacterium xinjiangense]